jgi:hypothetical protein
VVSAAKVQAMNGRIRNELRPLRLWATPLRELIERHRHDPRLALSFDPLCFYGLGTYHGVPLPVILFHRHIDHDQPTHVLAYEEGKFRVLPVAEYDRKHPGQGYRNLPTLVQPGTVYNVFRFRGRYHGVHHWDGCFRPERTDHYYPLQGDSPEAFLAHVPAMLARLEADQRAGRFIPPHLRLVEAGVYRGFALYQAGSAVHAIPQREGPLIPADLVAGRYSRWLHGESVEEVRRQVDRVLLWSRTTGRHGGPQ